MKNKMDCCSNSNKKSMKGGKNMVEVNKNTLIWIVIGLLFLGVIYLTFKTGNTNAASVQTAATTAKSAASQMVGGC